MRQLLLRQVPSPAPYVQANLTGAEKLALGASPYPSTDRLFDDLMLAIIDAFERTSLGLSGAVSMSLILLVVAFVVLVVFRLATPGTPVR